MRYQPLGSTGDNISQIGFGCAPMGGYDYGHVDDQDSIKAVHKALDMGINFFDTADIYGFGHAESVLATALGAQGDKVVVATKFGLRRDGYGKIIKDNSPANVVRALENSLRRLRLEAISLYQIHWPDPGTPLEETFSALLACQKAGKIKHIGCSNFSVEGLDRLRKSGKIESLQIPYNLIDRGIENETLCYCREAHISTLTYSSLARGALSGKYTEKPLFRGTDSRAKSKYFLNETAEERKGLLKLLKEIALKQGKTMSQTAVRWILDNPSVTCAIVGFKNAAQVEDIRGALEWQLSAEDYNDLAKKTEMFIN